MTRIFAAATLAVMLGGCSVYREAVSTRLSPTANWRAVATAADHDNLRNWRNAWDEALPEAKAADSGGVIAADPILFDPDRALADPLPPAGTYRCQTLKLGKVGAMPTAFTPYPWFDCNVTDEGEVKGFHKLTGSQRPTGLLFPDAKERAIFLGTLVLGDETAPLRYGADDDRDMIGYIERIEAKRWRLVMPYPRFESKLDIIELVPAK